MSEAHPCPFCGGSTTFIGSNEDQDWFANTWWVQCDACEARGPSQFNGEDRWDGAGRTRTNDQCRAAAVDAWNGRVSDLTAERDHYRALAEHTHPGKSRGEGKA